MSYPIIDLALEKTQAGKIQWHVTARETQYLTVVPKPNGEGALTFYLTGAGENLFLLTVKDESGVVLAKVFSEDLSEEDHERLARLFRLAESQARGRARSLNWWRRRYASCKHIEEATTWSP